MNHDSIAAHDTAARYVADRLSTDEEREFEAHLLDCPQCVEEVEQQLGLRDGLLAAARNVAQQNVARSREIPSTSPTVFNRPPRWLQAAAAVLAAVSITLGLSLMRTRSALQDARARGDELQRLAQAARETSTALERRNVEARSNQTATRKDAVVPTAVFALTAVRSGGEAPPINRLIAPPTDRVVVLTVDLPPMPDGSGDYAVDLRDRSGREIWSGSGFRRTTPDTLSVAVDRALLPDGVYALEVRSRTAAGELIPAGRFPFDIASR